MIKHVNTMSKWLQTTSGPFAYISRPMNQGDHVGSVRYNSSNSSLEAWDGNTWITITTNASVEPTGEMCEILEWAQERMRQDQRIQQLVETNPTVADAHANYVKAAEQLAIVTRLVEPA